jgi:hypothetical protein
MKVKTIRILILCLGALLLAAPLLRAQDFSKYRSFALGTTVADVLKLTDQKLADVTATNVDSPLSQELTWWPPYIPGASYHSDSVEQILFSFYKGELYKISVTYDQRSTEGLTAEDMVQSISTTYGRPTSFTSETDSTKDYRYDAKQKPVAAWDDSQYSLTLVRLYFTDRFGLVIYTKRVNADAELAIIEAAKRAQQEGPRREAARQKKQTDDLEVARQKNQKSFRP